MKSHPIPSSDIDSANAPSPAPIAMPRIGTKKIKPGAARAEPVISALKDFAELRVLRIVDARILAADINGSLAAVTVEHLWWDRLSGALAEVQAEMLSDLETPKFDPDSGPGPAQLHQIERLNQMRSIGTLTEAEFAQAKRDVLNGAD